MKAVLYLLILLYLHFGYSLREFRTYSLRHVCDMAEDANYGFAYSKYPGQRIETKGRTNSNKQDFRHECKVFGGKSKCHICEEIICESETGYCNLQLQGVNTSQMSINIPVVSDAAWAVNGAHRQDFGGKNVTHFCVFLSGGKCLNPYNTDYSECEVRCFGHGFPKPAVKKTAMQRSVIDIHEGMGRWLGDGQVDLWVYPRNCSELKTMQNISCTYSGNVSTIPSFNPQGYTFTISGSGIPGFVDGPATSARFNFPEDVAVDEYGKVFVADTKNNAIRMIYINGTVVTIAGKGPDTPGFRDGSCNIATFSMPKGLDVRHETVNGVWTTVIAVADTGNHRIRRIEINTVTRQCTVRCLTGLCGNDTLSAAATRFKATPLTGFADGSGLEARFSAPESVAFMEGNNLVVADTGNFLLRWVIADAGNTTTLAGVLIPGERDVDGNPLPGCVPPCMQGQQGYRDGNLTYAQFYNPLDVTRGPNNTVWVVDEQRVRIVELPNVITRIHQIQSMGRVSTIAGSSVQGFQDGIAQFSSFYLSSGITVDDDGVAYVVDEASCRVRRVTPYPYVSRTIPCNQSAISLMRPSGCISYDPPLDNSGRKISRVEGNIQYNFGWPYEEDVDRGMYIKNCLGAPPPDIFDKHFVLREGDNLVVDDDRVELNEFSEQGMAILVRCDSRCTANQQNLKVEGTTWYSDRSSVCLSAAHMGVLSVDGGIILITIQRREYLNRFPQFRNGSLQNGIQSSDIPRNTSRVFTIERFNNSNNMVHSIAGSPSAPLQSVCGYRDGQPATFAQFNNPAGIAMRPGSKISDKNFLYIADTNNHRIRALSAVCTMICENGGRCVGDDKCQCAPGWTGVDCTTPVCAQSCGKNSLCVAPNTCGCKPGYSGENCDIPLCQQRCLNGGVCSAPDTCSCPYGWFDSNCTTPVCSQTCGNGGNCTAPDKCSCPAQWTGDDCRIPVCKQECKNSGYCVAPDTCACSPEWSNYDCSTPVCHQGYFEAYPGTAPKSFFTVHTHRIPTYKNCVLQNWCNATNEFECDQLEMEYGVIRVPSGPEYRYLTGRKVPPTECMNIELPLDFIVPYQLLYSDNTTTGDLRYSPYTPYTSNDSNPWRGYLNATVGRTGPWTYQVDRQIAYVNWLNQTQGRYVCANGGTCVAPEVCACAEGWAGFDCRTPICSQGYWKDEREKYVSGEESADEIELFERFMNYNGNLSRLQWPYSNRNFSVQFEYYNGSNQIIRPVFRDGNKRYYGPANYTRNLSDPTGLSYFYTAALQGGYRCSIRASTKWENEYFVFDHPNYYSRYMDKRRQLDGITYTHWENMRWYPIHQHSIILDKYVFNISYAYTNEGWRRRGIWNRTDTTWQFGLCVMEFYRNCSDKSKQLDLRSGEYQVFVQDTDLSFRPVINYTDLRIISRGRWKAAGGECVDEVVRGCFNNGTCVAPNTCKCAKGWSGYDCSVPICSQTCNHHGNCTFPDTCTCERGWTGFDCSIPICAQECNNGGKCVAPDTCQCFQFNNTFYDGRIAGGRPLYRDENGDPLLTGWTGFDCSVPICVQAQRFLLNVPSTSNAGYVSMGGHGANGILSCTDSNTQETLPRCPQFDVYVTGNDGRSFQTGCGWDPFDTGCCILGEGTDISCYKCKGSTYSTANTFYCVGGYEIIQKQTNQKDALEEFVDANRNFRLCGKYHNPRYHDPDVSPQDYGIAQYYADVLNPDQSSYNYLSNVTSNRFLCNVQQWTQGDYIDDAGLGGITGAGSVYGLSHGRHVRINTPNMNIDRNRGIYSRGPKLSGEGVYQCYNRGSCLAPDICTCTDGYSGYDCNTPLCRHLQPSGAVTGCLNGGICISKDKCDCIQTTSVLHKVHPEARRGRTGWTGTDCSMPMCSQGFYDPYCNDLPQAPGGEGCYRCANGGNCTAPDTCTCAPGWTGYDCRTPVCEVVADPLTRTQLGTIYEEKIVGFEQDPCGVRSIYGINGWKGRKYARGNCTQPNQCTCLCKIPYNKKNCKKNGRECNGPWQDQLFRVRNVLINRGPQYVFGSTDCAFGFEGNVDSFDRFVTCHQTIYFPSRTERDSLALVIALSILGFLIIVGYRFAAVRLKRRFLMAKIERRRTKRSSEESMLSN